MANDSITSDRGVRTAAWAYLRPRATNALLVLALTGLPGFMLFGALALDFLRSLGT